MAIELNRDNYESEAAQAKGTVLVDFWGPQCKPCLALTPAVEKIEEELGERIRVGKVDATKNRMLCARLRVMSLPTFIVYKDGAEMARLTGEDLKASQIREAVEKAIK